MPPTFTLIIRRGIVSSLHRSNDSDDGQEQNAERIVRCSNAGNWQSVSEHKEYVLSIAFLGWNNLTKLVSGSVNDTISSIFLNIWQSFPLHRPHSISFCRGSESTDRDIYIWNAFSSELFKTLKLGDDVDSAGYSFVVRRPFASGSVSLSPINEQLIVASLDDGTVQLLDVTNDESVATRNHIDTVCSIVCLPSSGRTLSRAPGIRWFVFGMSNEENWRSDHWRGITITRSQ